jgi:hypothetical protein
MLLSSTASDEEPVARSVMLAAAGSRKVHDTQDESPSAGAVRVAYRNSVNIAVLLIA